MSAWGRRAAAAALAAAWFGVQVGTAGVENTHHDMRLYNPSDEKSVCVYCHVPHGASTEGLLVRQGSQEEALGRAGAFCYSCHDGTVMPTALIEAPDGTLGLDALTKSHGLTVADLAVATGGLENAESVRASGLVAADGAPLVRIECTACHDPHSNAHPPFLKAPLDELCEKCHSGRGGRGTARRGTVDDTGVLNGPHPVGMAVSWSGKDRKRPEQVQPEMVFNAVNPKLRVPGLKGDELSDPNRHWATGGHLAGFGADPAAGKVMCSTCHSAHAVGKDLLVLPAYRSDQADDPLCSGCHGKEGSPQNPGGTPFYHPAGRESLPPYATSTVPRRDLLIQLPSDWPVSRDGAVLCGTCHRAHQGRAGSKCLRDNGQGKKYTCDVCHLPEEDVTRKNSHHKSTWLDKSAHLKGRTLSWNTGPGEPGDLVDGLTCVDCHGELAKSAHNW